MNQEIHPLEIPGPMVRAARLSDTGRIVEMVAKLAAHHGDTASLSAEDLLRDVFAEPSWLHLLVAEVEGELVGYVALCGLMQLQAGARGADMHHIFVEDGFRGRGIGVALIEGCKRKARELSCRYMTVSTRPENLTAQAFYSSLGFELRPSYPPRFRLSLEG